MEKLKFGQGSDNAKLHKLEEKIGKRIFTFSLLSGHTCPFAQDCLSKVVDGKLVDGPNIKFRCYSATNELIYRNVHKNRAHNTRLLRAHKSAESIAELIEASLPPGVNGSVVRLHIGGDFYSQAYFDAWLIVARNHPKTRFYAYTKATPYWVKRLGDIPKNIKLIASRGGRRDDLIDKYKLRSAKVFFSVEAAESERKRIDHDDSIALAGRADFGLMIHGIQPAGSEAMRAKYAHWKGGGYAHS
jgi:hypothetical protein